MVSNLSKMARSEGDTNLVVSGTSMPFSIMAVLTFLPVMPAIFTNALKKSSAFLIIYLLNGLT